MSVFVICTVILVFIVIFQIAKASEYVSVLKGEKNAQLQSNKINAFLMLVFLVLGLVGAWYCNVKYGKYVLSDSASVEGVEIDRMMYLTLAITGFVCVLTQILLFWFAYKFQYKENRKAYYFSHSTKLEVIWTSIPAVAMTVLVVYGLIHWFKITGDPPKDHMVWEITGKQFNWIYRLPGKPNKDKPPVFGRKDRYLIDSKNDLGLDFRDKEAQDDIMASEIHLVKGVPVKLVINSRDVIHDVGLVHFRMKMDAVPGLPTTLWFTPKYSTREMKEKHGSQFEYEISCDQMCGSSHYAMRGIIKVHDTQEEYMAWLNEQSTLYATLNPPAPVVEPLDAPGKPGAPKETSETSKGKTASINLTTKKIDY
jgi:cytochrome c oxidase subunit II